MTHTEIPAGVHAIADKEGCNHIERVGAVDGFEVFSLSEVDEESGIPIPTGFPLLVLWNGEAIKIVSGEKSLRLLSRLNCS